MLRHILFDVAFFANDGTPVRNSRERVLCLLEALAMCNRLYLEEHPETPLLYESKVKYIVPEQFEQAHLPEVAKVRQWLLAKGAPAAVLDAFKLMADQVGSGEHFREIPRIIENGGGDCFPLSQKIIVRSRSTGCYELLALGELRHVYPAYEALSYNFTKCAYEFKTIVGFVDKGQKPVSLARLSNGTDLIATNDHKFWSVEGSGQNARRIGVRTMGEYVEAYTDFKKGKLSKNQRGVRSRIIQAHQIPALDRIHPHAAQAYLAGIYAAEGEFDGKHTRIGQHKPWVREKIETALSASATGFHYQPGRGATPGSGAQYSLHGGRSNPLVAMMRSQGHNSFDMRLPQEFLSGDQETVARLLEGHGDGDAWRPENGAYKRPNIDAVYATSSDALMEQLRLGTLILGRPHYAYRQEEHQGQGHSPIWRLHEYNAKASKLAARAEMLTDTLPGLRYGTVRHAMPAGSAHVGCIEVEGNHNFFLADGTLVSNCDNLASWRVAELRMLGVDAKPYITWRQRPDGGTTYHVIVRWPDGSSEDPSLLCGMGGWARAAERDEEVQKLAERTADYIQGLLTGVPATTVFGAGAPSFVTQTPSDFGKGPMYSQAFWTDDAYENWSPTRPQAFYANPLYPGGLVQQSGPLANTLWRGEDASELDDDVEDRVWGAALRGSRGLRFRQALRKARAA